jgi:putative transcriptional regulator
MSHPSQDLLLSFASGGADLPHRVMLEAHLAGCAACCAAVSEAAALGATLLRGVPEEAPPAALWESLRAKLDEPGICGPAPAPHLAGLPLPPAALAELPAVRPLRWRWGLAPGARYAVLARDLGTRSVLLVGHIPPRRSFPRHLHVGPEDVAVLTGGYEDEMGHYEAGQYTAYEPGTVHEPLIEPGATCWTLTRLEKPNQLFGWQGWLQRLLA